MRKSVVYAAGLMITGLASQPALAGTVTDTVTGLTLAPENPSNPLSILGSSFIFGGNPAPGQAGVGAWSASIVSLPTITTSSQTLGSGGSFAVDYQFDLLSSAKFVAFSYEAPVGSTAIGSMNVVLDYSSATNVDSGTQVACPSGCGYNPTTQNFNLQYANLAAGYYTIVVTGKLSGGQPGFFNGAATVSAVPVPGALLLFGSGILGLVGMTRRKRNAKAN